MRQHIRSILKKLHSVRGTEKGVITLEFSLIFGVFLLLIFFIFELCRFVTISSVIDLTLSQSARITSTTSGPKTNYTDLFRQTLKQEGGIWSGFIDEKRFSVNVQYCQTVAHVIRNTCSSSAPGGKALAIYRVAYDYKPVLYSGVIPGTGALIEALKNALSLHLVYVQEYERNG